MWPVDRISRPPSTVFNYFNKTAKAFPGIGGRIIGIIRTSNSARRTWKRRIDLRRATGVGQIALKSLPGPSDGFSTSPSPAPAGNLIPDCHWPPPAEHLAMPRQSANSENSFGYLTAIESAEHGYFGGYLVISELGRPLEFHCTAPIRPSRAQQILYGPTLEPYLLGEQISVALLNVAKLKPCVILTDCAAALEAREKFASPVVLLLEDVTSTPAVVPGQFEVGAHWLQLPVGYEADERSVVEALTQLAVHVDLAEPFSRIREAISEAQRIGGSGTEVHEQAA